MNLELIRWIDSIRHADGWQSLDHYVRESERSLECETVGFVIHERQDSIMVAQSRMTGKDGAVTEVIQIPFIAIQERHPRAARFVPGDYRTRRALHHQGRGRFWCLNVL